MDIRQWLAAYEDETVNLRRTLHKMPECAFEERETSAFIQSYLGALCPSSIEVLAGTGVKAVFLAPGAKRTVAIRADIDALPVAEETGLPFASQNEGRMHACGHDAHMAMALTAAKIVSERRPGINVVFIFQPAEEALGGAEPMVAQGVLENPHVDEVYGLHLWPDVELGRVGIKQGRLMAAMNDVNIEITGRSCHGARPQQGRDAIVAAAHFITAAQTILSRGVAPGDPAVLTLGRIEGGEARNVISAKVRIEGTVRSYSEETSAFMVSRVNELLAGIERMFDVKCENRQTMSFPPVINPRGLYEKVYSLLAEHERAPFEKVMMSEDFSFYQKAADGFYAMLGVKKEKGEPLHSCRFDFDERALIMGVEYYLRVLGID